MQQTPRARIGRKSSLLDCIRKWQITERDGYFMEITGKIDEVRRKVKEWRKQGLSVGLVPTMGYLHEGHKSLIDRAVAENDRVVVSDFVNPIQFGAGEDLATYPRDIEADKRLCGQAGAHLIFHPQPAEMYAPDFSTYVEMQEVSEGLCGKTRPTHFRGVCTVVCKLFHIVMPDRAYFGQKDAQQLAVIRRMVRDLDMDIQIVGCPIIREPDGLAKSSRNTYLNEEERKAALVLSKAVFHGQDMMEKGERDAGTILSSMKKLIEAEPLAKIDYVEMVDADTIAPLAKAQGRVLTAMAVYIGSTRLIDNFIMEV
jgi:pantoate--beta-alanine ligase